MMVRGVAVGARVPPQLGAGPSLGAVGPVERLCACDEALRGLAHYEPPDAPAIEASPCAAIG